MISAGCVKKNFWKCEKEGNTDNLKAATNEKNASWNMVLKDRMGAEFHVVNCCNFCYNIIFNHVPLSLLGISSKVRHLNVRNYRINLTTENKKQADEILEKYVKVFYYNEDTEELQLFTRGHFNRGVE